MNVAINPAASSPTSATTVMITARLLNCLVNWGQWQASDDHGALRPCRADHAVLSQPISEVFRFGLPVGANSQGQNPSQPEVAVVCLWNRTAARTTRSFTTIAPIVPVVSGRHQEGWAAGLNWSWSRSKSGARFDSFVPACWPEFMFIKLSHEEAVKRHNGQHSDRCHSDGQQCDQRHD